MKKHLPYFIGLIFLSSITSLIFKVLQKSKELEKRTITKQIIPNFTFYDLNGVPKNSLFLKKKMATCIFYFNSDCEHCQYEANEIKINIHLFEHIQIVMVSYNSVDEIKIFSQKHNLNKKNITFLQDKKHEFYRWFGKTNVPALFIYDKEFQLVKKFQGGTKMEDIFNFL